MRPLARSTNRLTSVSAMSPRTVQHRHPLCSSTTSSVAFSTSRWSMPISPNSLTMTAVAAIAGCFSTWLSTVVLPLPRNPVSRVTGVREAASIAVKGKAKAALCCFCLWQQRIAVAAALHVVEHQLDRLAEPGRVDRVVIDHVVGQRVQQDVEPLAVEHQPRHDGRELLVPEDHLELRDRVRPDPVARKCADLDVEAFVEAMGEPLRRR